MDRKEFSLFVLCGGVAALANMGSRWVLNHLLPYAVSICLAYLVGMLTAFVLFKVYVFGARQSSRTLRESLLFVVVNAVALLQTLLISIGLADYLFPFLRFSFYPHDVAHVVGVAVPVLSSYLGHKYLTFKV